MTQLTISSKELEAVTALGSAKRYRYFIKRVADSLTAWSLWDGKAWFTYGAQDGRQFFPLWPAREYADLCCTESWKTAEPQPIDAGRLIAEFLPAMSDDGVLPTVFPLATGESIEIAPDVLLQDLEKELAKY